jgi:hypothetical protein
MGTFEYIEFPQDALPEDALPDDAVIGEEEGGVISRPMVDWDAIRRRRDDDDMLMILAHFIRML